DVSVARHRFSRVIGFGGVKAIWFVVLRAVSSASYVVLRSTVGIIVVGSYAIFVGSDARSTDRRTISVGNYARCSLGKRFSLLPASALFPSSSYRIRLADAAQSHRMAAMVLRSLAGALWVARTSVNTRYFALKLDAHGARRLAPH